MPNRIRSSFRCLALAAMVASCGGGGSHQDPAPAISRFYCVINPITKGESVQLVGLFSGGSGVIDHGVGSVTSGTPIFTTPASDTTYTLTVTNPAGLRTTAETQVIVYPGSFRPLSSLVWPRTDHTATLLVDGRVFIAGGWGGIRGPLACEIFDSTNGTYQPSATLDEGRSRHTATLLPSGRVMICGGTRSTQGNYFNSILAFDPVSGSISPAGTLLSARSLHSATLLPDGNVLIAGGIDHTDTQYSALPERFDPVTGVCTATGPMNQPRALHTATLLPSGKVIILGGSGVAMSGAIEQFDPVTGQFTTIGSLIKHRMLHTATLLPNGKIFIAGGWDDHTLPIQDLESFDPATGISTVCGTLTTARTRVGHTATLLDDGRVLLAGGPGYVHLGPSGYTANGEIFDPLTNQIKATGPMIQLTSYHTAIKLRNGDILFSGGRPAASGPDPSGFSSVYH